MGLQRPLGPSQAPLVVPYPSAWIHSLIQREPPALRCPREQSWQEPARGSSPPAGPRKGGKALFLRRSRGEHKDKDNPLGGIRKLRADLGPGLSAALSLAIGIVGGAGCHCSPSQSHLPCFFTPGQAPGGLNPAHGEAIGSWEMARGLRKGALQESPC